MTEKDEGPECPRDRAIGMVEDGLVSAQHLLLCCLKFMSHDEVERMLDANELSDRFTEVD